VVDPRKANADWIRLPVSLNALRAFEAAARHLSFTRAADELAVTQAAISHQVKGLEERLGAALFRRTPRGLVLTDEGLAMQPALTDAFRRLAHLLARFETSGATEVVTVGVVGTFASWLLARLPEFRREHPWVDVRLLTNNNVVDLVGESLDCAIRFGDGNWHGIVAESVLEAPLTPLCAPALAASLAQPQDLATQVLLRSYRPRDWPEWLLAAGASGVIARGPTFDASTTMVQAAMNGHGVALAPAILFQPEQARGALVAPFACSVDVGRYWLTRLGTRTMSDGMQAFRAWLLATTSA
jgi:LysR family transcriptional regulator of beta-lactamase